MNRIWHIISLLLVISVSPMQGVRVGIKRRATKQNPRVARLVLPGRAKAAIQPGMAERIANFAARVNSLKNCWLAGTPCDPELIESIRNELPSMKAAALTVGGVGALVALATYYLKQSGNGQGLEGYANVGQSWRQLMDQSKTFMDQFVHNAPPAADQPAQQPAPDDSSQLSKTERIKRFVNNVNALVLCLMPGSGRACDPQVIAELKSEWKAIGVVVLGSSAAVLLVYLLARAEGKPDAIAQKAMPLLSDAEIAHLNEQFKLAEGQQSMFGDLAKKIIATAVVLGGIYLVGRYIKQQFEIEKEKQVEDLQTVAQGTKLNVLGVPVVGVTLGKTKQQLEAEQERIKEEEEAFIAAVEKGRKEYFDTHGVKPQREGYLRGLWAGVERLWGGGQTAQSPQKPIPAADSADSDDEYEDADEF